MSSACISHWRGTTSKNFSLIVFACFVSACALGALPEKLGDLDGDGKATVLDLVRMINHINGSNYLSSQLTFFADMNQDGVVNQTDIALLSEVILNVAPFVAL